MTLTDTLKDPFAGLAALFGSVFAFTQVPLLSSFGAAIWTSAPDLFTLVTVGTLTIPKFWPPQTTTDWIVLGFGLLMVGYVGSQVYSNFDRRVPFIGD